MIFILIHHYCLNSLWKKTNKQTNKQKNQQLHIVCLDYGIKTVESHGEWFVLEIVYWAGGAVIYCSCRSWYVSEGQLCCNPHLAAFEHIWGFAESTGQLQIISSKLTRWRWENEIWSMSSTS